MAQLCLRRAWAPGLMRAQSVLRQSCWPQRHDRGRHNSCTRISRRWPRRSSPSRGGYVLTVPPGQDETSAIRRIPSSAVTRCLPRLLQGRTLPGQIRPAEAHRSERRPQPVRLVPVRVLTGGGGRAGRGRRCRAWRTRGAGGSARSAARCTAGRRSGGWPARRRPGTVICLYFTERAGCVWDPARHRLRAGVMMASCPGEHRRAACCTAAICTQPSLPATWRGPGPGMRTSSGSPLARKRLRHCSTVAARTVCFCCSLPRRRHRAAPARGLGCRGPGGGGRGVACPGS